MTVDDQPLRASGAIEQARQRVFAHLAGAADGELVARFLKGRATAPLTRARLVDGKVRILLTKAQMDAAFQQSRGEEGRRPNLTATLDRFLAEPTSMRAVPDPEGRGSWHAASTAAVFYRALYASRDYSAAVNDRARHQGVAINGWTQWAFRDPHGPEVRLVVTGDDLDAVNAWLADPSGALPEGLVFEESTEESAGAGDPIALSRGALERICRAMEEVEAHPDEEAQLAAFRERFSLQRLARMSGAELLEDLHGRESRDCLEYWLEFKSDATFETLRYGSIRGGSALKFVVYQSAETREWFTGNPQARISVAEAAAIAERQRDQLLAAAVIVEALPLDPDDVRYRELQQAIEAAAPDYNHLAFFHKTLALWFPEKLDDYHSVLLQNHVLVSLGLVPEDAGLYSAARFFVSILRAVRERLGVAVSMFRLTTTLNRTVGPPVKHWRIGTGDHGELWEEMRQREVIALGYGEMADLTDVVGALTGREGELAVKEAYTSTYPDKPKAVATSQARQVWQFLNGIQEGDRVYAASGYTVLGIGEVTGPYFYEAEHPTLRYRRRVKWLSTTPYKALARTGLQTTVYPLSSNLVLQAQGARHLLEAATSTAPRPVAERIAKAQGPVATQLERKGQVVLFGPPGTGKTYHALKVAEEVVARAAHGLSWAGLTTEQRTALKGGGDPSAQRIWTCTFHPAYGYEDFVEGLKARPVAGGLDFRPEPGLFQRICALAALHRSHEFVLVIDEFNRGDAPRIFGELLTLLELDKRDQLHVQLPLSGARFTVPRNVRILATMNTADRSISLLDAALRRRFGFVEYLPDPRVLVDAAVEGISLAALLTVINERLLRTLGDRARNLQVGHSYLMTDAQPISSMVALKNALRYDLLPLLQEYCAEDPRALNDLLGSAFYDLDAQRFREVLFDTGNEPALVQALLSWAPDRLGTVAEESADEPEEDE